VDTQFLPISVDLYRQRALTKANLRDVDLLLVNRSESLALTACKKPVEAAKYLADLGPKTIVTKLGDQGCLVWSDDEWFESQPFNAPARDPLGAGDLFGAAFSFGCLQKWDLKYTSDFANAFAALSISRDRVDLPGIRATQDFMNTRSRAAI